MKYSRFEGGLEVLSSVFVMFGFGEQNNVHINMST